MESFVTRRQDRNGRFSSNSASSASTSFKSSTPMLNESIDRDRDMALFEPETLILEDEEAREADDQNQEGNEEAIKELRTCLGNLESFFVFDKFVRSYEKLDMNFLRKIYIGLAKCQHPGCKGKKGYTYTTKTRSHLKQHYKNVHKDQFPRLSAAINGVNKRGRSFSRESGPCKKRQKCLEESKADFNQETAKQGYTSNKITNIERTGMNFTTLLKTLNNLAPLDLAESWDNVGLLIEPPNIINVSRILLTNDLTLGVMDEAEQRKVDMIITYHPIIFKPLKSITTSHWKENIIGRCIAKKIAVYSPHTSLDSVKGGVNDWLISAFGNGKVSCVLESLSPGKWSHKMELTRSSNSEAPLPSLHEVISEHFNSSAIVVNEERGENRVETLMCKENILPSLVSHFTSEEPNTQFNISKFEKIPVPGQGVGRKIILDVPMTMKKAIGAVKCHLKLPHLRVAMKYGGKEDDMITTVAVCAGAGVSVLRKVSVDLILTGEMSHHDVLEFTQRGINVILAEHSNTERGYLSSVLEEKLSTACQFHVEVISSTSDMDPLIVM